MTYWKLSAIALVGCLQKNDPRNSNGLVFDRDEAKAAIMLGSSDCF